MNLSKYMLIFQARQTVKNILIIIRVAAINDQTWTFNPN